MCPAHAKATDAKEGPSVDDFERSAARYSEPVQSAPSADRLRLKDDLKALEALDSHKLRVHWRKMTRQTAPEHLPRYLLLRVIAYRMQARVYGDLSPETVRYLAKVARDHDRRMKEGGEKRGKLPPPIPPVPLTAPRGKFKPGTLLGREFNGTMHRVIVVESGFAWNGATYKSLSEIARRITGTHWNGPRFFGLRDRPKRADASTFTRPASIDRTGHV